MDHSQRRCADVSEVIGPTRHSRAAAGFTFIEVVLVVAIASALVVPMMANDDPTKLRAAAQQMSADIEFAQIESITHSDDVRVVVFDTTNHVYHLAAASDTATPITNPVGALPYSITFGTGSALTLNGVTIASVSVGGDDMFGFGPYGELDQTTDATVTLAAGGYTITITIDAVSGETTIGNVI